MSTFLESIELVSMLVSMLVSWSAGQLVSMLVRMLVSILRIMAEVRVLGDILTVSPQMLETGPGG